MSLTGLSTPIDMPSDNVGIVEKQFFTFGSQINPLVLASGQTLPEVTLAYETYGQANRDKSNAILLTHALTGDSHAAGYYADQDIESAKPGWWDNLVGPGKAFDTNQYWIICSNVLGGCQGSTGPSSVNPLTQSPYGLAFPIVTVGDMVNAQIKLMEHLGITKWLAVAGGSIGGFQALEWTLRYPDKMGAILCIASGPRVSAQGIAFNSVGRHAIVSDPAWQAGDYSQSGSRLRGLAIARMLAHITYLSEESLDHKFGRRLQSAEQYRFDFSHEFAVESYLQHQGNRFLERFDPNSYLYITKAMDYFDLEQDYGPLTEAFKNVTAKFLILSYTSDWLFPTAESKRIVTALMQNDKDVSYMEIDSPYGHDAFLLETEKMTRILRAFLGNILTAKGV